MVTRFIIISLCCLIVGCNSTKKELAGSNQDRLSGTAEDLWGNKVELADYAKGVTAISPFSPAACGYCLLDGYFVEANYVRKTNEMGGKFLYQSLFEPQIDVYSFLKLYRADSITTLTYPLELYNYHRNGFPYLMGFKNGKEVYSNMISDYAQMYKDYVHTMWPQDQNDTVTLSSSKKFADNFVTDDKTPEVTYVLQDTAIGYYAVLKERLAGKPGARVSRECDLSEADLPNNLLFTGPPDQYSFGIFQDQQTPIRFDSTHVFIGDYAFLKRDVGVAAIFPNPFDREKYVWLRPGKQRPDLSAVELFNDFSVWRSRSGQKPAEVILDGFFEKKPGNVWEYADSLTIAYVNLSGFCKGGICPLPPSAFTKAETHDYLPAASEWDNTVTGSVMTLGDSGCRFPSISAGASGQVAVTWEEEGDIFVAVLQRDGSTIIHAIENTSHDSFNPKVVWQGDHGFVAYLSDKDGWYRLYGRFIDGDRLSPDVLVSESGTYDVIMPALAADSDGRILAAWTQWKANYRMPRFRFINERTLGLVRPLAIDTEGTDGYINAWYFSLTFDPAGNPAGAWNQHYPAYIGVCSGNLSDPAASVTEILGDIDHNENGGYPSTAFDNHGHQWVVRETWARDMYGTDKSQQILAARFDPAASKWSAPYVVSTDKTRLNQTPQMAGDKNGTLWVAWSGRPESLDSTWGIYLANFDGSKWSDPVLVSTPGICARAPQIAVDGDNGVWLTWHSGVGQNMKIKVLRFNHDQ